ncbi:MAG: Bug family tripartite tricarboxylate transporter substrate binding protein [Burkholderiales bacterium]
MSVRALFVCLLVLPAALAGAQAYPSKAVRMIVPSTPGGGPDIMARAVGQKLTEAWGQAVVIENRGGAGGIIGSEAAAKAPPDGYTLVMANAGSHAVNASLYAKLPYDPVKDFAPVTLVSSAPNILIVHPSLPAKTVRELVALAKQKPDTLTFGSGSNGSTAHLTGELFKLAAGVRLVHVPFKGAPAAVIGVISGEVALAFPNIPPALPQVKAGKLRALGVTTLKRAAAAPEIPTLDEAGLPGFEAVAWFGVLAPAGTPRDIVLKVSQEIARIVRTPEMQDRLRLEGAEAVGSTPEQFAETIRRDIAKWAVVVKASGARAD